MRTTLFVFAGILAHLAGLSFSWRSFVRGHLQHVERSHSIGDEDRTDAFVFGTMSAFFWPITVPFRALYRASMKEGLLHTDKEKLESAKKELEHIRLLASHHNLPLPELPPELRRH